MELTRTLSISAEELFDQIEKSVLADIREATGKEVARDRLDGYKYQKRAHGGGKNGTPMDVKIKRYRYPRVYEVKFSYAAGTNTVRYEVTDEADGCATVLYREEAQAHGGANRGFWGALNRRIYERRLRSRAEQALKALEDMGVRERRARASNPALEELEDGE